jgi:hypothetical protein
MGTQQPTRRLCSEIQLFDLCDLEECGAKEGRFCTRPEILAKFEAIKEEDERSPEQYLAEEIDEDVESEELGLEDEFDADEYGDEDL